MTEFGAGYFPPIDQPPGTAEAPPHQSAFEPLFEEASGDGQPLLDLPQELKSEPPETAEVQPAHPEVAAALDALIKERYGRFMGFARRRAGAEATEVLSTAYAGYLASYGQNLELARNPEDMSKLLFAIIRHKAVDHIRMLTRRREILVDDHTFCDTTTRGVESTVMEARDAKRLADALRAIPLSANQKDIFDEMVNRPGQSWDEVGQAVGISAGAARVSGHRVRKKLRAGLQAQRDLDLLGSENDGEITPPTGTPRKLSPYGVASINGLQDHAHEVIASSREHRQPARELYLPAYMAPWKTIGQDLRAYFALADPDDKRSALIVYPHREQLRTFTSYIGRAVGRSACTAEIADDPYALPCSFVVDTAENITARMPQMGFDYVITTDEVPISFQQRLMRRSRFLLQLNSAPSDHQPHGEQDSPLDYRETLGRSGGAYWRRNDSLHYLQEAYLALGRVPSNQDVKEAAQRGAAPPIKKLCEQFDNLADLKTQALASLVMAAGRR